MTTPAAASASGRPEVPTAGRSIAGSSGVLLAARISINLGYFVAAVFLAHLLVPSQRGAVAFITVTALVISAASRLGLDNATSVFVARDVERRPAFLANVVVVGTISSTLVAGAASLLLWAVPAIRPANVHGADLVLLLLGAVFAAIAASAMAYLIGCRRFFAWSAAGVATSWGYAAGLVAMSLVVDVNVTKAAFAWTIAQALGALVALVSAILVAGIGRPRLSLLRTSSPFALRAWIGSFTSFLNARVDQTIMGAISTERALGIYAVAVNAGEVALYLPEAVSTALIPVIASSRPEDRVAQTMRVARVLLVLTFVSTLAGALFGTLLIPPVFGADYTDSVVPFLCLLPGTIGYACLRIFSSALLASGSPARSSTGFAAALVTGVAFDFLLIPRYGATGAAVAASLAFFAGGATATVLHRRTVGYPWRELVPRRADVKLLTGILRRFSRGLLGRRGSTAPSPWFKLHSRPYYTASSLYAGLRLAGRRPAADAPLPPGVTILGYHRVCPGRDVLGVTPERLRSHLELVLERGGSFVSLHDGIDRLGSQMTAPLVAVTFDDGYLDNLEVALPILEELQAPATIFLVTGISAGRNDFHWYRGRRPAAIRWDEARAAAANPLLDFEAHGVAHRRLTALDDDAVREEIAEARSELGRELGTDADVFSYAGGFFGEREVAVVRAAGYRAAVTTTAGVNVDAHDPYRLKRLIVTWSDNRRRFAVKLTAGGLPESGLGRFARRRSRPRS